MSCKQRSEVSQRKSTPKININRKKRNALKKFKGEKTRVILTADKGVAMVVTDKKDYVQKAEELLGQQQTYKTIPTDPTTRQKNRLINLLKNIRAE